MSDISHCNPLTVFSTYYLRVVALGDFSLEETG